MPHDRSLRRPTCWTTSAACSPLRDPIRRRSAPRHRYAGRYPLRGGHMTRIDDVRKTIETTLGTLTPAKAQQRAKGLLEPDARKDQVAKTAGDLLEWSQKNRQKLRDLVRREIRDQLEQVGVASRA